MTTTVNIAGVDKGELLAELFNNSRTMGMGFIQAAAGPDVMTADKGREIVAKTINREFAHDTARMFGRADGRLYFDYLFGRPLKVDLSGDEVDAWGYDRDNGGDGSLARIVEKIRANHTAD
jgi:hypothetical protein